MYGFVGSITAAFGGLVEHVRGMRDQVLVERVVLRHEHRERALLAPAGPAGLLPHRGPRPGYPTRIAASSDPMSIPSSSALVEATATSSSSASWRSSSRRSEARYPAR